MNLKGVVFDLDHTLFDRYKTIISVSPIIYEHLKEYLAEGITSEILGENICDSDKNYVIYGWEKIHENLCRKNIFSKIPDFETYRMAVIRGYLTDAVPFPFVPSVLEYIKSKGLKTALITNGKPEVQQIKINMLGLEKYMDEIIICGALGIQKPKPEPFLKMSEMLNIKPSELLYVGDNPFNDVEGSRNAGFVPVWIKTTGVWPEGIKHADFELDSVKNLPSLLDSVLSD